VIGKCANPECGVPFRYFRAGKLFRFDLSAPFALANVQSDRETYRRIEDFWLCGSCASKMTLVSEGGLRVTTCPLPRCVASLTTSGETAPIHRPERFSGRAGVRWQP
jgi:hypothetical protein